MMKVPTISVDHRSETMRYVLKTPPKRKTKPREVKVAASKPDAPPREIMLSFFDYTTEMVKPWAKAGYLCYAIDLQHAPFEHVDPQNENIVRVGADINDWLPPPQHEIVFSAFFPPCTDLATSGAQWFPDKGVGRIAKAVALFHRSVHLAELFKCPYLIENPVSTISSYWRQPDFVFHPYHYGNAYEKTTCLWTGGGFVMPPRKSVVPTQGKKLYWLGPTKDPQERANLRSKTPSGFARAVHKANDPALRDARQAKRTAKKRQRIKNRWADRCALTGLRNPQLVRAVHLSPDTDSPERLVPSNGIALAPHVHQLLDQGLIGFNDDGTVLLSPRLAQADRDRLNLPKKLRRKPTKRETFFISKHRATVFLAA